MKKSQNRDNPIHGKLLTKSFTVGHIKNATFTVLVARIPSVIELFSAILRKVEVVVSFGFARCEAKTAMNLGKKEVQLVSL